MAPPCYRYQGKTCFPLCTTGGCPSNSALRPRVAHELALRAREKTRPPRTRRRRRRKNALGIGPSPAVPGRLGDRGACQLPRRARAAWVGDRAAAAGAGDWGPLCWAKPGARLSADAAWGGGFQGRDKNRSKRDEREVPRFSSILTWASVRGCWGGDGMGRLTLVPPPTPRLAPDRDPGGKTLGRPQLSPHPPPDCEPPGTPAAARVP